MDIVRLRLSPEKHAFYKSQADFHNLSLSAYLRQRLEEQDNYQHQFEHLEQHLVDIEKNLSSKGASGSSPLLYELLLLLRTTMSPGDRRMVHSELERQGIPIWKGTQEAS